MVSIIATAGKFVELISMALTVCSTKVRFVLLAQLRVQSLANVLTLSLEEVAYKLR